MACARLALGTLLALGAGAVGAVQPKGGENQDAGLETSKVEFFLPELYISTSNAALEDVIGQLPNRAEWQRFSRQRRRAGLQPVKAFIDPRSGAATNIIGAFPLIPGRGVGNDLTLAKLSARLGRSVRAVDSAAVADAARRFVVENAGVLGIDAAQLGPVKAAQVTDELWQVSIPQAVNGVPVRDSRVALSINNGNVVVVGTEVWGNGSLSTDARVTSGAALDAGFAHLGGRSLHDEMVQEARLEIAPVAPPEHQVDEGFDGPLGKGYAHRLVWTYQFRRAPGQETWEALVDAQTGDLIAFQDKNQYVDRSIVGGIYPLTNTGVCPTPQTCGTMQPGTPMPFADTGFASPNNFADASGVYNYTSGTATTTLTGRYVDVADNCGAISASSATGNINLGGTNNQHDCTTPGSGGAGNTPASRSAFYELNRIAELARGWLPANAWLQSTLTANVNINLTCNAFWGGGTVNFYRTGGGCRNTGEIGAVFDHEWGHGMDDNDAIGTLSNSSEGYADIASIYRLQASCVGHGFFDASVAGSCGNTADGTGRNVDEDQTAGVHCATDCSGVRDADWAKHADNTPDTPLNHVCTRCTASSGPCGRQVHCAAAPIRQAAWDLVARDLQAAPFSLPVQSAFIVGNKTFYQGSGNVGLWHACTCGSSSDGCGATHGYMQWITADDDNGNLNDGTPHMTAIHAAFNRHGVACATPTPQNSGCSGFPASPLQKPAMWVEPGVGSNAVKWDPVPGAVKYWVFRADGFAGCLFGKAKIATVNAPTTTYTDSGLLAGRTFSYNVVAVGASDQCYTQASRCVQSAAQ